MEARYGPVASWTPQAGVGGPMQKWKRRLLGGLVVVVLGVPCALWALAAGLSKPRPVGQEGPGAQVLADRMESSVELAAWSRTGAVSWTFAGRNTHLWDRQRHLDRVQTGDRTTLIDLHARDGRAWDGDVELHGNARVEAVQDAWGQWANDSFWLNPVAKLHDDGVVLKRVETADHGPGLLVEYASGGVTPGDAYLWHLDDTGRPVGWTMWAQILPIQGMWASWAGWTQLSTGAWVATDHTLGPVSLQLTDVVGAETLAALTGGDDPFLPILGAAATSP